MSSIILLTHLIICVNAGDGEATTTAEILSPAEAPATSIVQGRRYENSQLVHEIEILYHAIRFTIFIVMALIAAVLTFKVLNTPMEQMCYGQRWRELMEHQLM
ncbi:hypothetical protein RchiOBHm_Chr2g0157411 [Rosa chinensis]|uniref:Uncharacterized protein n=1 Tax=Rosa chinensis TaxID=74649 RepID=A0A2P6S1P5_ROSCH|nr:hypothetical protein RchiOBHm_Chr2g0157411 [Rosa chinensis]